MRTSARVSLLAAVLLAAGSGRAADRVLRRVDATHTKTLDGSVHPLAQTRFDRGDVNSTMPLNRIILLVKPSAAQQAELDQLLIDQQNPSSPRFHQWLRPEEFGERFGLSASDHAKVVAWLAGSGFTVQESARARNWIAFSGTAQQVSKALHTAVHHFEVNGKAHFANAGPPSVPEALAEVIAGFTGLDDFHPAPLVKFPPKYNQSSEHFLAPADFATIYNVAPLWQAGMDGTGQSIAVVGQSQIDLNDIRAFRSKFHLPANDPQVIPPGSDDPGHRQQRTGRRGRPSQLRSGR